MSLTAIETTTLYLRAHAAPLLQYHGFQGKGLVWKRQCGELVHVIEFQVAKYSTPEAPTVSADLGSFHQAAYQLLWDKQQTLASVLAVDCYPTERLGRLRSRRLGYGSKDYWWRLAESPPSDGEFLVESLTIDGIPWLASMASVRDLLVAARAREPSIIHHKLQYAALLAACGYIDEAGSLITRVDRMPSQHWRAQIDALSTNIDRLRGTL